MKVARIFSYIFLIAAIVETPLVCHAQEEAVIDAVVASVDGKPITLLDISKQLRRNEPLSFRDLDSDVEARTALEFLILEKLILLESEARKVAVTNAEIEEYIDEVAARNNLSRQGFEAALMSEGKNLEDYKRTLKLEILRSKLTASFVKDNAAVSEEEIDAYLSEHPELSKSGAKVKLRQILIRPEEDQREMALTLIKDLRAKIEAGESFEEMARAHSNGAEAAEGGSLGVVAEEDLSRTIFDAIYQLVDGEVSEVVESPAGYHIFLLESRLVDTDDSNESIRDEVRKTLLNQKMREKSQGFFASEIYKLHTVDKKI